MVYARPIRPFIRICIVSHFQDDKIMITWLVHLNLLGGVVQGAAQGGGGYLIPRKNVWDSHCRNKHCQNPVRFPFQFILAVPLYTLPKLPEYPYFKDWWNELLKYAENYPRKVSLGNGWLKKLQSEYS